MLLLNGIILFSLGGGEWALIGGAILLLFGGKKIPELAKGLGKGIREFKNATKEVKDEIDKTTDDIKKEIRD